MGVGGDALAAGEVAGQVPGGQRLALDREPLPVRGGQGAGAERLGHRQPVVVVDDRGVGRLQRLGAEVPLGGPGQHVVGTPHDSAIAARPMLVASAMITYSRFRFSSGGRLTFPPACTRWSVNPVRASISTSTDAIGTRGSIAAELGAQRLGLGRDVLGGQRRDDQLPVVAEPDLARPAAPGELGLQVRQRGVQLVVRQGQGVGRGRGLADQVAELQPLRLPLLRGEQERGRVGVPARPRARRRLPSAARRAGPSARTAPSSAGRR